MLILWAAAAAVVSLAATPPTAAKPPVTITVRLVGDDLSLPFPEDYCEPTGRYIDLAQLVAAVDKESITLATFYDCAEMVADAVPERYIIVKALKSALSQKVPRDELLRELGEVPKSEMSAAVQAAGNDKGISRNASEVLGGDIDLGAKMEPADADENGYYIAGVGHFKNATTSYALSMTVGITSVKGHVMSLATYLPGQTVRTVAESLKQAKFETRRLVAANQP